MIDYQQTNLPMAQNKYALEIFEAVLQSSVPPQTQYFMRAVLCIHTNSFEYEDLRNMMILDMMMDSNFMPPQLSFPSAKSPALLQKFVGLAYRINVLAHCCIDRCIQRHVPIDPSEKLEPPSWIEEQRAILAFWRVQLYFEIKMVNPKDYSHWNYHQLRRFNITPTYLWYIPFIKHQCFTVLGFIEELRSRDHSEQITGIPESSEQFTLDQLGSKPLHPFELPKPPKDSEFSWKSQALPSSQGLGQQKWRKECRCLTKEPPAIKFFPFFHCEQPETFHLLDHRGPGPYRKLGFAFWDRKMVLDIGFWSPQVLDAQVPRLWFETFEIIRAINDHDNW